MLYARTIICVTRFCRRHRHLLNPNDAFDSLLPEGGEADLNVTSTSRPLRLPDRLESRSHAFLTHLRSLSGRSDPPFAPDMVCCFDELALHFASSNACYGGHSTTAVLKQSGADQADAVVVIAATADGSLLPPMIVFRVSTVCRTAAHNTTSCAIRIGTYEYCTIFLHHLFKRERRALSSPHVSLHFAHYSHS